MPGIKKATWLEITFYKTFFCMHFPKGILHSCTSSPYHTTSLPAWPCGGIAKLSFSIKKSKTGRVFAKTAEIFFHIFPVTFKCNKHMYKNIQIERHAVISISHAIPHQTRKHFFNSQKKSWHQIPVEYWSPKKTKCWNSSLLSVSTEAYPVTV